MKRYLIVIAAFALMLCGCKNEKPEEIGFGVYYINSDSNELLKVQSTNKAESVDDWIDNTTKLLTEKVSAKGIPLLHDGVTLLNVNKNGDSVSVNLSSEFDSLSDTDKLLVRAGLTKEYTQNSSINSVLITVEGRILFDSKGNEIGAKKGSEFLELSNDNLNNYMKENMTLYYLSSDKESLVSEKRTVYHSASILKEQAVVNELVKGSLDSSHKSVLANELSILSVTVLDGICYVNFDDNANTVMIDTDPKLQIYSIVNSLNKVCGVEQVVFSISGNNQIPYRNTIDISQPFTPDFSLVEDNK